MGWSLSLAVHDGRPRADWCAEPAIGCITAHVAALANNLFGHGLHKPFAYQLDRIERRLVTSQRFMERDGAFPEDRQRGGRGASDQVRLLLDARQLEPVSVRQTVLFVSLVLTGETHVMRPER